MHWRHGSPNLRLAGYLIMGSVPFAFLGTFVTRWVGDQEAFLKTALGYALLFAATTYTLRMYLQLRLSPAATPPRRPSPSCARC